MRLRNNDDLPPRLVQTGMASFSASRFKLRPGLRVVHALAGIDHRTLGMDEQGGRFLDVHGVCAVAGAQHRRVIQRLRHFLVPHVGWNFDDDGSAAAVLPAW